MRVGVIPAVGIHHGNGAGQLVLTLVVVGDDEIDSLIPAEQGLPVGGDAAVHGDNQGDALGFQGRNGLFVEAVALLDSAGDIVGDAAALTAEKFRQQAGGGDAVHVVVAEHSDPFTPLQGQAQPVSGRLHIPHGQRVGQRLRGGEKLPGMLRLGIAPAAKHPGRQGRVSCLLQGFHGMPVILRYFPSSVLHCTFHPF